MRAGAQTTACLSVLLLMCSASTVPRNRQHRDMSRLLLEVCHVLGMPCPDLVLDQGSGGQVGGLVVQGGGGPGGTLIVQEKLFQEFPPLEAKAILGHELVSAAVGLQRGGEAKSALRPSFLQGLYFYARLAWAAQEAWKDLTAEDEITFHMLDPALAPYQFRAVVTKPRRSSSWSRPGVRRLRGAVTGNDSPLPDTVETALPFVEIAAEALLLRSVGMVKTARRRAKMLLADHAAALAAGDARAAASALLRAKRQRMGAECAVGDASEPEADLSGGNRWMQYLPHRALRGDLPEEVRARDLLRWAQTRNGRRLMELAEARRRQLLPLNFVDDLEPEGASNLKSKQPIDTVLPSPEIKAKLMEIDASWTEPFPFQVLMAALFMLPFIAPKVLVRFSAIYTLCIVIFGLLAPLMYGTHHLAQAAKPVVTVALLTYAACVRSIWATHIRGGLRYWASLGNRLTSAMGERLDILNGLAHLSRAGKPNCILDDCQFYSEIKEVWQKYLGYLCEGLKELREELAPVDLDEEQNDSLLPAVERAIRRTVWIEAERIRQAIATEDSNDLLEVFTWWWNPNFDTPIREVDLDRTLDSMAMPIWSDNPRPEEGCGSDSGFELLFDAKISKGSFGAFVADALTHLHENIFEHTQVLAELRADLEPLEEFGSASTMRLKSWIDMRRGLAEAHESPLLARKIPQELDTGDSAVEFSEGEGDCSDLVDSFFGPLCLALAALASAVGAPAAAAANMWGWAATAACFGAANAALLLSHRGLALPSFKRRANCRCIGFLQDEKKVKMHMRNLADEFEEPADHGTQPVGLAGSLREQLRGAIMLQAVTVLKNISYILSCARAELKSIDRNCFSFCGVFPWEDLHPENAKYLATSSGLRLLLAMLPAATPAETAAIAAMREGGPPRRFFYSTEMQLRTTTDRGPAGAVTDEDCAMISAMLHKQWLWRIDSREEAYHATDMVTEGARFLASAMRKRLVDSRRRVRIMFRMIDLESKFAGDKKKHCYWESLFEEYLNPIFFEGRVPLSEADAAALRANSEKVLKQREEAIAQSLALSPRRRDGGSSASSSNAAAVQPEDPDAPVEPEDKTANALGTLSANRLYLSTIIKKAQKKIADGRAEEAEATLKAVFSSVIVAIREKKFGTSQKTVAVCVGHRDGDRIHNLEGVNTSIRLRAFAIASDHDNLASLAKTADSKPVDPMTVAMARSGPLRCRLETIGAFRSEALPKASDIIPVRSRSLPTPPTIPEEEEVTLDVPPSTTLAALTRKVRELEVPLTQVSSEAPDPKEAARLWLELCNDKPDLFGPGALTERREALRKLKAVRVAG